MLLEIKLGLGDAVGDGDGDGTGRVGLDDAVEPYDLELRSGVEGEYLSVGEGNRTSRYCEVAFGLWPYHRARQPHSCGEDGHLVILGEVIHGVEAYGCRNCEYRVIDNTKCRRGARYPTQF